MVVLNSQGAVFEFKGVVVERVDRHAVDGIEHVHVQLRGSGREAAKGWAMAGGAALLWAAAVLLIFLLIEMAR